jgi:HK97 family phage portal protein
VGIFLGSQEKRQWAPEPVIPPFPGADFSGGVSVTSKPDLAMTVPTVWACVLLKAGSISSLPLNTYRKGPDIPIRIDDPSLVKTPSEGMTQSQWLHTLSVSLDLRGNAYGRISSRDGQLRPTTVDLLNPDTLQVKVNDAGKMQVMVMRTQEVIPEQDLWHLPGLTFPGMRVGMSPITYAAATLGIDIHSRQFASDFFNGGGIPKALLKSSAPLDQKQASDVKSRLMAAFRSREPIVIPAGIDYVPIAVKPEESQFLATQSANVAQIARFFGIPPEMVGGSGTSSMTYANVEQRSLDFLTYGLAPWLKRIEDAISLLLPNGNYVEFDVSKLLRTDAETAAKVALQHIAGKVYAPSEVRARLGEPPMTEAQKIEADMVPLVPTATGGVRLPQGAAKVLPGPEAPVPADDLNPVGV